MADRAAGRDGGPFRRPAEAAVLLWTGSDARTLRAAGDEPTLNHSRCDVLTGWACHELEACTVPVDKQHGVKPHITVTLAATTALGLDDKPGNWPGTGRSPPTSPGRNAADGSWRRLRTDPASGALLDQGTTTYAPPTTLAGRRARPRRVDHVDQAHRTHLHHVACAR